MFNLAAVKVPLSAEEQKEDAKEHMKKHIYNYTKKSIALERRLRVYYFVLAVLITFSEFRLHHSQGAFSPILDIMLNIISHCDDADL